MERCPKCKEGILNYRWFAGLIRLCCGNPRCRCVFDAAYVLLGVLAEDDEMYADMRPKVTQ